MWPNHHFIDYKYAIALLVHFACLIDKQTRQSLRLHISPDMFQVQPPIGLLSKGEFIETLHDVLLYLSKRGHDRQRIIEVLRDDFKAIPATTTGEETWEEIASQLSTKELTLAWLLRDELRLEMHLLTQYMDEWAVFIQGTDKTWQGLPLIGQLFLVLHPTFSSTPSKFRLRHLFRTKRTKLLSIDGILNEFEDKIVKRITPEPRMLLTSVSNGMLDHALRVFTHQVATKKLTWRQWLQPILDEPLLSKIPLHACVKTLQLTNVINIRWQPYATYPAYSFPNYVMGLDLNNFLVPIMFIGVPSVYVNLRQSLDECQSVIERPEAFYVIPGERAVKEIMDQDNMIAYLVDHVTKVRENYSISTDKWAKSLLYAFMLHDKPIVFQFGEGPTSLVFT